MRSCWGGGRSASPVAQLGAAAQPALARPWHNYHGARGGAALAAPLAALAEPPRSPCWAGRALTERLLPPGPSMGSGTHGRGTPTCPCGTTQCCACRYGQGVPMGAAGGSLPTPTLPRSALQGSTAPAPLSLCPGSPEGTPSNALRPGCRSGPLLGCGRAGEMGPLHLESRPGALALLLKGRRMLVQSLGLATRGSSAQSTSLPGGVRAAGVTPQNLSVL